MSIKRFGRLAGTTQAKDVLADVSPANSTTPFTSAAPGSKMLAYGEGANSHALNRAIGAVAQNIEDVLTLLDLPASKSELLEPEGTDGVNFWGFTALKDVNPVSGVNLGDGAHTPVVWVLVGMHQGQVGQFIQLARTDVLEPGLAPVVSPTDVLMNAAGDPYFTQSQQYGLSPRQSQPDFVPPIQQVVSDIAPYGGAGKTPWLATWDTDGCYLSGGDTWAGLHVRPGCYVYIPIGSQAGFYMVAALSNSQDDVTKDKAVLVHGLHRVVLNDVSLIVDGMRVRWERMVAGNTATNRVNSAYVMFTDVPNKTVYLSTFAGSDDVREGVSDKAGDNISAGAVNTGSVGQQEDDVTDNPVGLIQANVILFGDDVGNPGNDVNIATVVSCIPAGSPVCFTPGAAIANQTANIFSPPGYLLNPKLDLTGTLATTGDYLVHCRTLTTTRERMRSGGLSAVLGSWFDDGAMQQFTPLYQNVLEGAARQHKEGYQPVVPYAETPEVSAFSPANQIAGESLWRMRVDTTPAPGGQTLEAAGLLPGMVLSITSPVDPGAVTRARVAHCSGNLLWLYGVTNATWDSGLDRRELPIDAGSTFTFVNAYAVAAISYHPYLSGNDQTETLLVGTATVGGDGVTVTGGVGAAWDTDLVAGDQILLGTKYAIVAVVTGAALMTLAHPVFPGATSVKRVGRPFIPGNGLNAAYHAHLASDPLERGNGGGGRVIQVVEDRPISLQSDNATFVGLELRTPTGVLGGAFGTDGGTLQLQDGNTAAIDFSSATDTAIDAVLPPNILGALNKLAKAWGAQQTLFSWAILHGCEVTLDAPGPTVAWVKIAAGFALDTNGTVVEVPADPTFAITPAGPGLTIYPYVVWDGANIFTSLVAPDPRVSILARLTVTEFGVDECQDMRMFTSVVDEASAVDRCVDLQVGGPDAHFTTLFEAVEFLNGLHAPDTGPPTRSYRILVRGSTAETHVVQFRVGGILIEGLPGMYGTGGGEVVGAAAQIRWSGDRVLFDLNGQKDIVFRNLALVYDDSGAASDDTISRVAFDSTSATLHARNIVLENVSIRAVQEGRLHGYAQHTGAGGTFWLDCTFTNCDFADATEFGIDLKAYGLRVQGCRVIGSSEPSQNVAGSGAIAGVRIQGANGLHFWLTDCEISLWGNCGVWVAAANQVRIRGCDISSITRSGAAPARDTAGVYVDEISATVFITECQVTGVSGVGGDANAVWLEDPWHVRVRDCHLSLSGGVGKVGIRLGASSQFCIVDGNQTNTFGIDNLGMNNSIGGMNRDD